MEERRHLILDKKYLACAIILLSLPLLGLRRVFASCLTNRFGDIHIDVLITNDGRLLGKVIPVIAIMWYGSNHRIMKAGDCSI